MSIFDRIPSPVRKAAHAVLPEPVIDRAKDAIVRRYYVRGYVNRTGPVAFAFRRYVLRKPPKLHRLLFHVTDHCNLNCRGCTHFSNISPKRFADLGEYRAQLDRLVHVFSDITEIFLLGGEPLLHPEMAGFIDTTREHFPHSRINVMTNGVLVPRMDDTFWESMKRADAYLLCDDYPVGPGKDEIDALGARHGVHIEWTDPREEFYKLPIDLTGSQDPAHAFRECRGVMNCPVLKDGRLYPCAYAAFIDIFQDKFGVEGIEATAEDSVSIDEDPYAIMEFLEQPIPWCRHCDFDNREFYEWDRSTRSIDEWLPSGATPASGAPCAPGADQRPIENHSRS